MKKITALVLALMMVLCAVSAFAATGSKTQPVTPTVETEGFVVKVVDSTEAIDKAVEAFVEANANGDILAAFPEDIKALLPEGADKINELVPIQAFDYTEDLGDASAKVELTTPYTAEQKIAACIGFCDDAGNVEWNVFEAAANDDGSLNISFTQTALLRLMEAPALLAVVSD